ncbi:MAG TPA: ABC transporter ATP-binding protein [Acidimicrobiales bacterium]|nr:ABC transporter ATP-binding protein [Acidimicrobiales bacterium]
MSRRIRRVLRPARAATNAEGGPGFLGPVVASLRPFRRRIAIAVVVLVAALGTTLAGPALVGYAINNGLVHHHSYRVVDIAGAAYVAVSIGYFVLTRVQTLQVSGIGEAYLNDLRKRVFSHLLAQPLSFFETESSGQLLSRMTADIDVLESLVQSGLSSFVTSIGLFIAVMIVLVVMSPLMWVVVVISLVPVVVSAARYRARSSKAYGAVREQIGDALAVLDESLAGVRVVQAFRLEQDTIERFRAVNKVQLDGELATVRLSSRFFPKIEWAGVTSSVVVLLAGALLVSAHLTTVGTVAAFVLYLANLFNAITSLSQLFDLLQSSGAALATVYRLLAVDPAMVDPERPAPLPEKGALELESIAFAYANQQGEDAEFDERMVLEGVDLRIEAGERLALVGPTGGGKSTLAKIAGRLYDPLSGTVRFGGVDLRNALLAHIRERIVVLPQEGFLFRGTVLENVALGRPGATLEEARAAVAQLGLDDWVAGLPDGEATDVGERGSRLSAGERQLVSLARAALSSPAVLILDEATSSIDPGTERQAEAALAKLAAGRTVIVVAHRLTAAERADRVAVMHEGSLAELGSHEELLEADGHYARLFSAWSGEELAN